MARRKAKHAMPPVMFEASPETSPQTSSQTSPDVRPSPDIRRGKEKDRPSVLARGDALRAAGKAAPTCWLPEPRPRVVHPDRPYQEVPSIIPTGEIVPAPCLNPPYRWPVVYTATLPLHPGPRDVRLGDRWLPWHRPEAVQEEVP